MYSSTYVLWKQLSQSSYSTLINMMMSSMKINYLTMKNFYALSSSSLSSSPLLSIKTSSSSSIMNEMRLFSTNNNKIQLTPEQIAIEVAKVEKYKLFIRQPGDILHINYYIVFMGNFFFTYNVNIFVI